MPVSKLDQAREMVARANRIIANEGVMDAFGHVTMRHPTDPHRYLMSHSRAPELVQADDIHEFTLDSAIIKPIEATLVTAAEADYFKVPLDLEDVEGYSPEQLGETIVRLELDMREHAKRFEFEKAAELRARALQQLKALRERLYDARHAAVHHSKVAARATDEYVHDHPWRSILAAASGGVVVGLLISRR